MTRWLGTAALVSLLCLGCGGGDGENLDQFVGTWQYTSGTVTTNCGSGSTTEQQSGNTVFSKGITSDLVSVADQCTFKLEVTGNTASTAAGQTCAVVESGVNFTLTVTAYTFTVSGTVADESFSATLQAAGGTGVINCTLTSTAKMQKVSK